MQNISDVLVSAYTAAKYCVESNPPVELRVGAFNPELDKLLQQAGRVCAALITPENPFSDPLSVEENAQRHERFQASLDALGLQAIPGYGEDDAGEWHREMSYWVLVNDQQQADTLASQYGQNAYVFCELAKKVRLVLASEYRV